MKERHRFIIPSPESMAIEMLRENARDIFAEKVKTYIETNWIKGDFLNSLHKPFIGQNSFSNQLDKSIEAYSQFIIANSQ